MNDHEARQVPLVDITGRTVHDADAFDLGTIDQVVVTDPDNPDGHYAVVRDTAANCRHLVPLRGLRGGPTGPLHTPYPERHLGRTRSTA